MTTFAVMIEAQEGVTWDDWRALIKTAEDLGFDGLWRSDHFSGTVATEQRNALALWPTLTLAAVESRRMSFGTLVSPISFRHPVYIARNAAALALLSNNRYVLGIGAGWNQREHDQFGFRLPPVKERMDRFEESLELIQLLLSGERVSFDGQYYQLDEAQLMPVPDQHIPVLIGGGGEQRTLRLVAKYADEWNMGVTSNEAYQHKTEVLDGYCQEIGRDPSTITRSVMISHLVGHNWGELIERARALQRIVPRWAETKTEDIPEAMRTRGALVGTPEEVADRVKELQSLGIQRLMLQTLSHRDLDSLRFFAEEVKPLLD